MNFDFSRQVLFEFGELRLIIRTERQGEQLIELSLQMGDTTTLISPLGLDHIQSFEFVEG